MPEEDLPERNSEELQEETEISPEQNHLPTSKHFLKSFKDVSEAHDADILYFCGDIEKDYADKLIAVCRDSQHRNVLFFLTTLGGDPDAAYRIARFLKETYEKFTIYIDTLCKSAGTLITLGADKIIMSDTAELGPLDVQILKTDELNQRNSVLDLMIAFDYLQSFSLDTLEETIMRLVENSEGQISTKSALEVASHVATNLFAPIYAQINPTTLGSNQRSVQIASKYGERLNRGNLQADALKLLVAGYPSHSFVIDRQEAREKLFEVVQNASKTEERLAKYLSQLYDLQNEQTFVINVTKYFITDTPK